MREWWFNVCDPALEEESHRLFDGRVRAWDGPEADDPSWGRREHDIDDVAFTMWVPYCRTQWGEDLAFEILLWLLDKPTDLMLETDDGALIVKRSRGRWTLIHDPFADRVAELLGLPLAPRVPEGHPGWEPPAAPTAPA